MTDLAYLDGHHAIIGASDAGKTWTAKFGVEELLRQRRHTLIIDPLGVWYGLRSSADGTGPGFDVPIFGGPHGDVPIRSTDGAAIAGIVDDQRVSAIVDLSGMTNGPDQRWFVRDLVARLRRRSAGNFHFVVDEADEFVPEKVRDDTAFALQEDMLWIAKKGRSAGWVQTLITQRTADISKSALSQSQTIIAHQLIAPQDQKPFLDYVKTKGTKDELAEITAKLASLPQGERYVYSPRRHVLELGRTPPLTTFDSSRTPPAGQSRAEPRTLAQLDVSAIAAALAPADDKIPAVPVDAYQAGGTVGEMLADRERQIADLEARLAAIDLERLELEEANVALDRQCDAYDDALSAIQETIRAVRHGRPTFHETGPVSKAAPAPSTTVEDAPALPPPDRRQSATDDAPPEVAPGGASQPPPISDAAVRGRKALDALVKVHPVGLTESQWATLAGYARTGGTWGTYKGALRASGLVEETGGLWRATPAGIEASGEMPGQMPAIGPDLAREWGRRVPGVRKMVDVLVKRWPHFTTRDALAADLGMTPAGGTFGTYLGRLRGNGLIEETGKRLRLHPDVMGEA